MNADARSRFAKGDNPFVFKWVVAGVRSVIVLVDSCRHVSNVPSQRDWVQRIDHCVVLANPGFMDPGSTREPQALELWAPDARSRYVVARRS
jgi:cleavage and polyadenylation specificity factor subunit 3